MNSSPTTRLSRTPWGSTAYDQHRGGIKAGLGNHNKFINLVVHDLGIAIGWGSDAVGGEFYGSIIYNNGWIDTNGRVDGLAFYTQNRNGTKRIVDNVVFNNCVQTRQDIGKTVIT